MATLLTLHDPKLARRFHAEGYWRDESFYHCAATHAAARPDAPAVRDGHITLRWRELVAWADRIAAALEAAGLRPGSRVSLWLPNRVEAIVVFLACARQGYVCNPSLHVNYTVAEVAELLGRIGAAAFIGQPGHGADAAQHDIFALLSEARPAHLLVMFSLEGAPVGVARLPLLEPGPGPGPSAAPVEDADKPVYLAFTSGTTGLPKGVLHSDNTLLANARALVADWGHGPEDVLLSLSPISHHIGAVALGQALVAGMTLVLNDPALGATGLDRILGSGATYVMGAPTHAMDVQTDMARRGLGRLGAVRTFYMAGSPIPREVARAFLAMGVTPQNVYGMSENSSHQYTLPTDDQETIIGTCGRACAGFEVAIFDPEQPDLPVGVGETGEVASRGACLMLGYFGDQETSEQSFNRCGWFLSGDLGRLDARGCLEILGRKKDLVIRGGHNIHPARVEDLAIHNAAIARAAGFGVDDARLGEKLCLAIIPAAGAPPHADAVLADLAARGLSKYDMPEYLVMLDEFPLTASGKVLKRELVAWVRSGRIAPTPVRWTGPR